MGTTGLLYVGVCLIVSSLILDTILAEDYMAYECKGQGQEVTVTCPQASDPTDAKFILVRDAKYGVYQNDDCAISCCTPGDEDCLVPMDEIKAGQLDEVKKQCDMQESSCSWRAFYDTSMTGSCPDYSPVNEIEAIYFACVYADGSVPTTPSPTTTTTVTTPTVPITTEPRTTATQRPTTNEPVPPPSSNVGAIVGGVLGGLCVVAIGILVALICIRRKQAQKEQQSRKLMMVNGRTTAGMPVYTNPGYQDADEEMVIGNGEGPKIRALSQRSSTYSDHYENVENGTDKNYIKARKDVRPDEADTVSHTTDATVYENARADPLPKPNHYQALSAPAAGNEAQSKVVAKPRKAKKKQATAANSDVNSTAAADKKSVENGVDKPEKPEKPAAKFEKNSKGGKGAAPVAKKAVGPGNLGKAQSNVDVSLQPKLDKMSPHKQSAPALSTSLTSTEIDIEGSNLEKSKAKSASAQALNRRSVAESEKSAGQSSLYLDAVDEKNEEQGKEIF